MTRPSIPSKEFGQNPEEPPPRISNYCTSMLAKAVSETPFGETIETASHEITSEVFYESVKNTSR